MAFLVRPHFLPDAPSSAISISEAAKLIAPPSGVDAPISGVKYISNYTLGQTLKQDRFKDYAVFFDNMSVDDIGKFYISASVPGTYLGGKIKTGRRSTELFRAAYFEAYASFIAGVPSEFDEIKNGFTYIGQPFEGRYDIYAMTDNGKRVKNYKAMEGYVDPSDTASLPYRLATFTDFSSIKNTRIPGGTQQEKRWLKANKIEEQKWKKGFDESSMISLPITGMEIKKNPHKFDPPQLPLKFAVRVGTGDSSGTGFRIGIPQPDPDTGRIPLGYMEEVIDPNDDEVSGGKIADMDFYFGRLRLGGFTEDDLEQPKIIPAFVEYYDENGGGDSGGGNWKTNGRDNFTYITVESSDTEGGLSFKEIIKSDTDDPNKQAKIEILIGVPNDYPDPIPPELITPDKKVPGERRRVEGGEAPFLVTPHKPKTPGGPDDPEIPDGTDGPFREQFKFWQKLGGEPEKPGIQDPENDPSIVVKQPWLKFPWDITSDVPTDPYAIGTYGSYSGSDKIIYRGEKNIRLIQQP